MSTQAIAISDKHRVLILGTSPMNLYHHRLELINELLSHDIEVYLACAEGEEVALIEETGCKFAPIPIDSRSTNPLSDLRLLRSLIGLIRKVRPSVVLTFYTKTNIYGGLACRLTHTPYIENITGLGTALGGEGVKSKIMSVLYKMAIKKASLVYFQNRPNLDFFESKDLFDNPSELLPGSGVALDRHTPLPYPDEETPVKFVFIGRVLPEKGIFEFVEAGRLLNKKGLKAELHIVGPADGSILEWLKQLHARNQVSYHGKVLDTREVIKDMHCTVFPSFYPEGMANVLLESAAGARPVITTDCPGCRETVDDGLTGYVVAPHDAQALAKAMEKFISLSEDERRIMGLKGRSKMEKEFDRAIVVDSYLKTIYSVLASDENSARNL